MTDQETTRRELLRGGVAATAAVAVAASAPALLDPAGALAAPPSVAAAPRDGELIASLLRVEQVLVFAYERTLATGLPSAAAQPVLASFLDQERAHVRELSGTLSDLGGTVPAPPASMAAFAAELLQLRIKRSPANVRTERQHVHFLIALETVIARHYRSAIGRLSANRELTIAAEIMANEAQHATILRELLSPGNAKRAVPSAFVAGVT
jgi:ferritin-like protein